MLGSRGTLELCGGSESLFSWWGWQGFSFMANTRIIEFHSGTHQITEVVIYTRFGNGQTTSWKVFTTTSMALPIARTKRLKHGCASSAPRVDTGVSKTARVAAEARVSILRMMNFDFYGFEVRSGEHIGVRRAPNFEAKATGRLSPGNHVIGGSLADDEI
jgi:hypothetical protein